MPSDRTVQTIILSTVIPGSVLLMALVALAAYIIRKRNLRLFNRGITPIADEEIESWKNDRYDEKALFPPADAPGTAGPAVAPPPPAVPGKTPARDMVQVRAAPGPEAQRHRQNSSLSSIQKPSPVIVYQAGGGHRRHHSSGEHQQPVASDYYNEAQQQQSPYGGSRPRRSTTTTTAPTSLDLAREPILARAPNARPGLTDETVQGDDAFIPPIKRQPSRLSKANYHQRHRSAAAGAGRTSSEQQDGRGRKSADYARKRSMSAAAQQQQQQQQQQRGYATPRMSTDHDDERDGILARGGPNPRQEYIGRAIG